MPEYDSRWAEMGTYLLIPVLTAEYSVVPGQEGLDLVVGN